MTKVKIEIFDTSGVEDILYVGENILWSGSPCYGKEIFEYVGQERFIYLSLIIGCLGMWCSLIFIDENMRQSAFLTFSLFTIGFVFFSYFVASTRKFVLNNLFYFLTDRRAIVFRRGKNWKLNSILFVISCTHSPGYPYKIISGHPFPSLQLGNLLSSEQVQPLGLGISHPGHSLLWNRVFPPVMFEYIDNAEELRELIKLYTTSERLGL